jgi:hypothetical protein
MMRADAFREAGGYDLALIAGEEPELCHRLRVSGWRVFRLEAEMTRHDLDMMSYGQWWRRQIRNGYGSLDVTAKHGGGPFARQVRSARIWTLGWLLGLGGLSVLATIFPRPVPFALIALAAFAPVLQALRVSWRQRHCVSDSRDALALGALMLVGKWGEIIGQTRAIFNRAVGRRASLIEYKRAPAETVTRTSQISSPQTRGGR